MSKRDNYYSLPENQTDLHLVRLEEEYQKHRHSRDSIEYHGDRVLPRERITEENEQRLGWDLDRRWMIGQLTLIADDRCIQDGHPLDTEAAMSWVFALRLGCGSMQKTEEDGKTVKQFLHDYHKLVTQDIVASLLLLARVLRPTWGIAAELLEEEQMIEDAAEHGIDGRLEQERAGN